MWRLMWRSYYNGDQEARLQACYKDRDETLAAGDIARSNGGRQAKFINDVDPNSFLFVLSDGPASRGGMFGFYRPEAEILYRQLHDLLGKDSE